MTVSCMLRNLSNSVLKPKRNLCQLCGLIDRFCAFNTKLTQGFKIRTQFCIGKKARSRKHVSEVSFRFDDFCAGSLHDLCYRSSRLCQVQNSILHRTVLLPEVIIEQKVRFHSEILAFHVNQSSTRSAGSYMLFFQSAVLDAKLNSQLKNVYLIDSRAVPVPVLFRLS